MKVKGYMEKKFQDCLTAVSLSFVMFCFQRFMWFLLPSYEVKSTPA